MKKALTIIALMALGVSTAYGGSILYETHIEDSLDFAGEGIVTVLELEFTIDQPSIISITYGVSCLLYTSPSPRDVEESRMPSSA